MGVRLAHTILLVLILVLHVDAQLVITSTCGSGFCRTRPINPETGCAFGNEPACACVPSIANVPCQECSQNGYIQGTACTCTLPHSNQDPNNAQGPCTPVVTLNTILNVTSTVSNVTCTCFNSTELGFYALTRTDSWYGQPLPPTCGACLNAGFGPNPGVLDDTLAGGVPPGTCNSYGGIDPEQSYLINGTAWLTCSGHGTWNATAYACGCDTGWGLSSTNFQGAYALPQTTCSVCAPWYGPFTPPEPEYEYEPASPASGSSPPPFCSAIYAPNPLNGTYQECSGGGTFLADPPSCQCFNSSTAGYWELVELTAEFEVWEAGASAPTNVNATVQTCAACNSAVTNGTVETGCLPLNPT